MRLRPGTRQYWFRSLVALLLVTVLSWDVPQSRWAMAQTRRPAGQVSDEDLFKAIVFLEGPVADQIPELQRLKSIAAYRELKPEQRKTIQLFQTKLMAELKAKDPNFFATFAQRHSQRKPSDDFTPS